MHHISVCSWLCLAVCSVVCLCQFMRSPLCPGRLIYSQLHFLLRKLRHSKQAAQVTQQSQDLIPGSLTRASVASPFPSQASESSSVNSGPGGLGCCVTQGWLGEGSRCSGTSEVLRLPGVVEGSQYLISAAAAILGDTFLSQLPRVTGGKEGGKAGGSLAALLQGACLPSPPRLARPLCSPLSQQCSQQSLCPLSVQAPAPETSTSPAWQAPQP